MKRKNWFAVFLLLPLWLPAIEITGFKTDSAFWDDAFRKAGKESGPIVLPRGEYHLKQPLEVSGDLTLIFEDGAVLRTDGFPLIRQTGGTLTIEGRGRPGKLICDSRVGKRGWRTGNRASVIDLNGCGGAEKGAAELVIRNMTIAGFNGIDAYWSRAAQAKIRSIDLSGVRFECREKGIGFNVAELGSARIENCVFEGGDNPIQLNTPIPGGVVIRGCVLRNFGRCGMLIGKAGQVADGCTGHVPNAIVHDNQLLGGGAGATIADSYTQGILIYGHNVSVQGNIVRDVNRGEPVPGASVGRQIRGPDGTFLRGKTILWKGKPRRLAGAAIYLKANRALVQGNICSNSGWRSVIEIKTGGKEHFVSVVNNVVDGRALAKDESFGFECNSGRSLWSGNLVYDMPHQAFVVRSGFENTFLNNLIVNAEIGFALSGRAPGKGELIAGNRFVNVKHPVALSSNAGDVAGPEILLPSAALLPGKEELPEPDRSWLGRQLIAGENVYICVRTEQEYRWMKLSGALLPVKKYRTVGPELAFNADQSGTERSSNPAWNNPLHPGWTMTMYSANEKKLDPADGHVTFDYRNVKSGKRSLKIALQGVSGAWTLRQNLTLDSGKRYRATAVVRGEEPENLRLEVMNTNGFSKVARAADNSDWQTLSIDFRTPPESGRCSLLVWGSKTTAGKAAWVDSISVRELEEIGAGGEKASSRNYRIQGENLLVNPEPALPDSGTKASRGKGMALSGGWTLTLPKAEARSFLRSAPEKTLLLGSGSAVSNFLLRQSVRLEPGSFYRLSAEIVSEKPVVLKVVQGKKILGSTERKQNHLMQLDFRTDSGNAPVLISFWGNSFGNGATAEIRKMALFRLQEEKDVLPGQNQRQ